MANKKITELPQLSPNDYNPESDLLVVQQPNGETRKMTATNVMGPIAGGGMFFLTASARIDTHHTFTSFTNFDKDLTTYGVPDNASVAYISLQTTGRGYPDFGFKFYTSSDYSATSSHLFGDPEDSDNLPGPRATFLNRSDKSGYAVNSCFVPIVNGRIYYSVWNRTSDSFQEGKAVDNYLHIYLHAYLI